jgi:thymidine kinase
MSLTLHTGPMMCGKTEALMRFVRVSAIAGKRCLVVRSATDTRARASHGGVQFPAGTDTARVSELAHVAVAGYDAIAVDEGQFFADLELCDTWASGGAAVAVAALDGSYLRKPFSSVARLIPLCDRFEKLQGVCGVCKSYTASFTRLLPGTQVPDSEGFLVGGGDEYRAVCRACLHA